MKQLLTAFLVGASLLWAGGPAPAQPTPPPAMPPDAQATASPSSAIQVTSPLSTALTPLAPLASDASLTEATAWLTTALPRDDYTTDDATSQSQEEVMQNSFNGCLWNINRGRWLKHFRGTPVPPGSTLPNIWIIRFEPRAGLRFNTRPMTAAEGEAFRQTAIAEIHASRPADTWDTWVSTLQGTFSGHVDAIDMSFVRLDSITVISNVTNSMTTDFSGTTGFFAYVTVLDTDGSRTQNIAVALRRTALLCGASNNLF